MQKQKWNKPILKLGGKRVSVKTVSVARVFKTYSWNWFLLLLLQLISGWQHTINAMKREMIADLESARDKIIFFAAIIFVLVSFFSVEFDNESHFLSLALDILQWWPCFEFISLSFEISFVFVSLSYFKKKQATMFCKVPGNHCNNN